VCCPANLSSYVIQKGHTDSLDVFVSLNCRWSGHRSRLRCPGSSAHPSQ
jgi:hypothetical protein